MFDKILVPLDRSPLAECVLPHAIALARCLDAQLLLLHVLSLPDKQDRLRAVDSLEWQLRRAEAESYLQGVCARMKEAGVACETQVTDGDAAEQIVECARDNEVGLVLIASHGQSGLSDWHVSSVVQKVIVRASTSLMIVRAYQPPEADIASLRYQRVLVPVDGSARAECVLPLAAALTRVPDTQASCWRTWSSAHRCPGEHRSAGKTASWPTASWSATSPRPSSILRWSAPNCRPQR